MVKGESSARLLVKREPAPAFPAMRADGQALGCWEADRELNLLLIDAIY